MLFKKKQSFANPTRKDKNILPTRFPIGSFGGRGEHSILEGEWDIKDNVLTVRLKSSDYTDWGGVLQLVSETEFESSWPFSGTQPSKEMLKDCVLELAQNQKLRFYNLTEETLLFLKD